MPLSQQTPFSNNTRKDSIHGHHQIANTEIRLIIFFAAKDVEALQSAETRPGADCGSDHELLIAKFRLKLKKVGKSTRPFRYNLIQILYEYTEEKKQQLFELSFLRKVFNKNLGYMILITDWTEKCIETIIFKTNNIIPRLTDNYGYQ